MRRARLVVGADGVQSVVRKTLHPDEPAARWSGLVALRGLVRGMPDLGAAVYYGRGCEAGTSPAGSDAVYWFISARADHPGEHPTQRPAIRAPASRRCSISSTSRFAPWSRAPTRTTCGSTR